MSELNIIEDLISEIENLESEKNDLEDKIYELETQKKNIKNNLIQ